jgi:hypothetical protein
VGLAVLLGGAAAMFFFAARRGMPGSVAAVVEAREYRLRDPDGKIRGAWGFAEDGAIRFVLQNGDNQRALRLNLLPDGSAGVTFADSARREPRGARPVERTGRRAWCSRTRRACPGASTASHRAGQAR